MITNFLFFIYLRKLRMSHRLFRPQLFSGKVNLVTGGGSGIGLGIAEGLARLGSDVVIASRNLDRINEAKEKLEAVADGGRILALEV